MEAVADVIQHYATQQVAKHFTSSNHNLKIAIAPRHNNWTSLEIEYGDTVCRHRVHTENVKRYILACLAHTTATPNMLNLTPFNVVSVDPWAAGYDSEQDLVDRECWQSLLEEDRNTRYRRGFTRSRAGQQRQGGIRRSARLACRRMVH